MKKLYIILKEPVLFSKYLYILKLLDTFACLNAGMCLTADPGVRNWILAWSHTFVEIDQEIISTPILLPSADSRRIDVSYKESMHMMYWLTA